MYTDKSVDNPLFHIADNLFKITQHRSNLRTHVMQTLTVGVTVSVAEFGFSFISKTLANCAHTIRRLCSFDIHHIFCLFIGCDVNYNVHTMFCSTMGPTL